MELCTGTVEWTAYWRAAAERAALGTETGSDNQVGGPSETGAAGVIRKVWEARLCNGTRREAERGPLSFRLTAEGTGYTLLSLWAQSHLDLQGQADWPCGSGKGLTHFQLQLPQL